MYPGPDFLFGVQHILRGAWYAPVWLQHRGHQCPWAGLGQHDHDEAGDGYEDDQGDRGDKYKNEEKDKEFESS